MVKVVYVVDVEGQKDGLPLFWEWGRYDDEDAANMAINYAMANLVDLEDEFDNVDDVTFTVYTDTEWTDDGYVAGEDW